VPDVWTLLQRRTRSSGALPLVTYLDPASGERTELSATSLANAAAKIANALRDEYGLEPGDAVALDLPQHWQRSAWCAGIWTAGCVVTDEPENADLVVTTVPRAAVHAHRAAVVVVSMHPFGLPVTDPLPAGVTDATIAVRQQPDAYLFETPDSSTPALVVTGTSMSQEEALASAQELGPGSGDRVAVVATLPELTGWLACLALPLAIDGSVVLLAGDDVPDPIREQERVGVELQP